MIHPNPLALNKPRLFPSTAEGAPQGLRGWGVRLMQSNVLTLAGVGREAQGLELVVFKGRLNDFK